MEKIIDLEIKKGHYQGAPCIFWCFDYRFHELLEMFIELLKKNLETEHVDIVDIAGGAKDLASPDQEYKLKTSLWEMTASLMLHKAPWIGFMMHADCGAYGKQFANEEEEASFYEKELMKARDAARVFFKEKGIDIPIKLYYADFTGLYELTK